MKHTRRGSHNDEKRDCDPWIQRRGDLGEEASLTKRTNESKDEPYEIELQILGLLNDHAAAKDNDGVDSCIGPRSDGIYWRVLPCLEAMAIGEVMCWFPVVEDFVAVLDWMVQRS